MGIFDKLENLKPVNTWRPYIPHCGIFFIQLTINTNASVRNELAKKTNKYMDSCFGMSNLQLL